MQTGLFLDPSMERSEVWGSDGEPGTWKMLETGQALQGFHREIVSEDTGFPGKTRHTHTHTYPGSVHQRQTAKETQRTFTFTVFGEKSPILFTPGVKQSVVYIQSYSSLLLRT